jgi:hypothetical protein
MPPVGNKRQIRLTLPLIATASIVMVLGCGQPENFREAFQYYDDSTGTVTILENHEANLRVLANQAAEGTFPDGWQTEVGRIKDALEGCITTEKQSMGSWNDKLKLKMEMLNWLEALRAACEEGFKPAISPEKTAVNMYHYLDLAGEMGRIVRSDREMLVGHYRSLH